jgi:hypothetical protein
MTLECWQPFYGSHSFGSGRYATYVTSNDTSVEDDACNGLPANTPDLTNRVAIVRRGGCFFDQKAATVAKYNVRQIRRHRHVLTDIGNWHSNL